VPFCISNEPYLVTLLGLHSTDTVTNKSNTFRRTGAGVAQSIHCLDCRLDDRAIVVRSSAETKNFSFSPFVHASSEAHLASYPMRTGDLFPGSKARPGSDAVHSPHLVLRSRISRSYNSSTPCRLHGGSGTALLCFTFLIAQALIENMGRPRCV
jgi:hypothetical protein